ncbi:MAG: glycosyltransferase family 2 protein [Magnetospirillum sp.]|nr:glycosyltransferase family 2 protein [Magnetospirillum sp.]
MDKKLVSIVAPVYNEERVLPEFVRRIGAAMATVADRYDYEIVLVDDGSRDTSLKVARELAKADAHIAVVELRRNYGQTAALQAGMDEAKGEFIVSLDADLQHFPEEIPIFLARLEEGLDVVCGWRHQRQEGIVRRWPSRAANALLRWITKLEIHDIGTTFRGYRTEIVRDFRLLGENHRFIPVFAKMAGARIDEIPIENIERPVGQSNYGIGRTFNVLLDLVFLLFLTRYLDRPIRAFGAIALGFFAVAFAIGSTLLVWALATGTPTVRDHSGWFLLSLFLAVSGLQFLLVGVLAEIIVRVYYGSGSRTTYKIRNVWRSASA